MTESHTGSSGGQFVGFRDYFEFLSPPDWFLCRFECFSLVLKRWKSCRIICLCDCLSDWSSNNKCELWLQTKPCSCPSCVLLGLFSNLSMTGLKLLFLNETLINKEQNLNQRNFDFCPDVVCPAGGAGSVWPLPKLPSGLSFGSGTWHEWRWVQRACCGSATGGWPPGGSLCLPWQRQNHPASVQTGNQSGC